LAKALLAFAFSGDVVEEVEHQQRLLQAVAATWRDFDVVQQVDQRLDVVAADHGAEQLGGLGLRATAPARRGPHAPRRPGSWP
jgi:hypothetical protein